MANARALLRAAQGRIAENPVNREARARGHGGLGKALAFERSSNGLHHAITLIAHSKAPAEYKRVVAEQAVALFLATNALWDIHVKRKTKDQARHR